MKHLCFVFFFLCLYGFAWSQNSNPIPVNGLPSQEVYDLLIDKKGFLWIAHDLGLSKYDGLSFTNFSTPNQTSLSVTDLIEDRYGRIWCHNFNGQILYVENEQLHVLSGYAQKAGFPRLALLNDQLIATTDKGLFICDTKSLHSKYITLSANGKDVGTTSLTVFKNEVIIYGAGKWFSYHPSGGTIALKVNHPMLNASGLYVYRVTSNNALLAARHSAGHLFEIAKRKDRLMLVSLTKTADYLNTITKLNGKLWLNAKTKSQQLHTKKLISGLNLTDMVRDGDGNLWYSSLKKGLMVDYVRKSFVKSHIFALERDDFVRCFKKSGHLMAVGTQNGTVILMDLRRQKILFKQELPDHHGAIECISLYPNGNFFIAASVGTWQLDLKNRALQPLREGISKDTDINGDIFFNATSTRLKLGGVTQPDSTLQLLKKLFPTLQTVQHEQGSYLVEQRRSRAVCFNPANQLLYVAFNNGLHTVGRTGINPVQYQGANIYASSLARSGGTVFSGDFNRGLFVINNKHIKLLTTKDGLLSNTVLKLRIYNDHLWIITKNGLQLFDIKKETVDRQLNTSAVDHGVIYDVLEANNRIYVATTSGVFEMPLQQKTAAKQLRNYLMYTIINNNDTLLTRGATLPYHQNNIQFHLSTPSFKPSQSIYYRYRLKDGKQHEWLRTMPNENAVHFAALMPGKYTFEALAFGSNGESAKQPVRFTFTILNPWWKQWWFIGLIALAAIGLLILIGRLAYFFSLRKERENFEKKLAVEKERHRIGAEIHDDISAGLSALKLQIGLLESKNTSLSIKDQISGMAENITNLSASMREVIWTLNTEHDTLANLIYYLHQQAGLFFSKTGININIELPEEIPHRKIEGEQRRNVYLIIKETFQNVIKHAQATEVKLIIQIQDNWLTILVHDNGIGLSPNSTVESSGLSNMKKRVKSFGGNLTFSSDMGTKVSLSFRI